MAVSTWITDTRGEGFRAVIQTDPEVVAQISRIDINVMTQHGDLIAVAAIALGIGEKDIDRFSILATTAMRKYPNMSIRARYEALIELAYNIKTDGA